MIINKETIKSREFRDLFSNAIFNNKGILKKACDEIGLSYSNLMSWMRANQEFKDFVHDTQSEAKESLKDYYEEALIDLVEDRNPQAVIFANKTMNKDRYSEKVDVSVKGDITVCWGNED